MSDPKVHNYTDGTAFHWYFNQYFPADTLTELHNAVPDKFILATEACISMYYYLFMYYVLLWSMYYYLFFYNK